MQQGCPIPFQAEESEAQEESASNAFFPSPLPTIPVAREPSVEYVVPPRYNPWDGHVPMSLTAVYRRSPSVERDLRVADRHARSLTPSSYRSADHRYYTGRFGADVDFNAIRLEGQRRWRDQRVLRTRPLLTT